MPKKQETRNKKQETTAEVSTAPVAVKGAQIIKGRVVSNKALKTVSVLVESSKTHPLYKKAFSRSKKYLVHTEEPLKDGDLVEIVKVRPISKNKHWIVKRVVGRDLEAMITEDLKEGANEAIAEVLPEKEEVEQPEGEIK